MAIDVSIIFMPVWKQLEAHLLVDVYDKDGGQVDPRIRIGFVDLPEHASRELVFFEMPCVTCRRPNHPLRRREGDGWDRLFYAPTCALSVRKSCSRSRAAHLEYERFKGIVGKPRQTGQLELL
jgi:hypothetical protein